MLQIERLLLQGFEHKTKLPHGVLFPQKNLYQRMHTRIKAFTHSKICKRKRLFQMIIDSSNFTFQQFGIHNDIIGWNDFKVENIQAVVTEQGTEL